MKALLISTACAAAPTLNAEPNISFRTDYYPVTGQDLESIHQSLQRNGPGGGFLAHTEWDIRWNYRWIESASNCRPNGVSVDVDITMLMPQPVNPQRFSAAVKQSWDRFYDALLRHEEHHRDYGIMAANELYERLTSMPSRSCHGFQNELSDLARRIIDKYDRMEKAYDRRTDHGIKEGVVLQ